jgi:transcriptional activator of cad operon
VLARSEDAGQAAPSRIQVGDWWVDPAANELGRNGQSIRIEPKAMQLLAVLAAQASRVVARDDLLAKVWPDVVVGDEAMTQTISKLRKALGDNPGSPSYIETISKRGYRLIAPVRAVDEVDPAPPPGAPPPAPQSSRTRPRFTLPLVLRAVAATAEAG